LGVIINVKMDRANIIRKTARPNTDIGNGVTGKHGPIYKFNGRLDGFPDSRMKGVLASTMKFID